MLENGKRFENLASIAYQLGKFSGSGDKNRWLETEIMKIYVRKSTRLILGQKRVVLDVATVEVAEEYRSKWILTGVMDFIESIGFSIYVENILNDRLIGFFKKRGYKIIEPQVEGGAQCAYLEDKRNVHVR